MSNFFDAPRQAAGFHFCFYENYGVQQSAQARPPRLSVRDGRQGIYFEAY